MCHPFADNIPFYPISGRWWVPLLLRSLDIPTMDTPTSLELPNPKVPGLGVGFPKNLITL